MRRSRERRSSRASGSKHVGSRPEVHSALPRRFTRVSRGTRPGRGKERTARLTLAREPPRPGSSARGRRQSQATHSDMPRPIGGRREVCGAWPVHTARQASPVRRAPEGPEGTGGLRDAGPNYGARGRSQARPEIRTTCPARLEAAARSAGPGRASRRRAERSSRRGRLAGGQDSRRPEIRRGYKQQKPRNLNGSRG